MIAYSYMLLDVPLEANTAVYLFHRYFRKSSRKSHKTQGQAFPQTMSSMVHKLMQL